MDYAEDPVRIRSTDNTITQQMLRSVSLGIKKQSQNQTGWPGHRCDAVFAAKELE